MKKIDIIGNDSNDFYDFLDKMKKEDNERINFILSQLEDSNNIIKEKLALFLSVNDNINKNKSLLHYYKKEFINRSLSFLLSLVITFGSAVGVYLVSKKFSYRDYYRKNITTYSLFKGLDEKCNLIEKTEFNIEDIEKVYLNIYSSWEKIEDGYKRNVKRYDISEYKFDYIESYLEHDVDYYGVDYELINQNKSVVNMNDLYLPEYTEVEESKIDNSEVVERFDFLYFMVLLPSLYTLYLFILYGFIYFTDYDFIFGQCSDAFDSLKQISKSKKITKEELKKIKVLTDEVLRVMNKNELLKMQFNGLYDNNKFLLDNPEELYSRFEQLINQINNDDVKKLIKEKA